MLRRGILALLMTLVLCCCSAQTADAPDVFDAPEVTSIIPFEPIPTPTPTPGLLERAPSRCFVVAVDKKAGMVISICITVLPKPADPTPAPQRF